MIGPLTYHEGSGTISGLLPTPDARGAPFETLTPIFELTGYAYARLSQDERDRYGVMLAAAPEMLRMLELIRVVLEALPSQDVLKNRDMADLQDLCAKAQKIPF